MVIRRQFKFWKYLSRYQFERIPIRRRYETKGVSFYTRPVPANGLLQFQRASPEKKVPETRVQRMICVKFQRTEWSAEWVRQALSQQSCYLPSVTIFVMIFVKASMIWWLVYGIINMIMEHVRRLRGDSSNPRRLHRWATWWSSRGCYEHATPEGGCYR